MWGVILVLGLCALGVYDSNAWFYVAAGFAGFVYFIMAVAIASIAASVKAEVTKINKRGSARLR